MFNVKTSLALIFVLCLMACNRPKADALSGYVLSAEVLELDLTDCFQDRAARETLKDAILIGKEVAGVRVLEDLNEASRYEACNFDNVEIDQYYKVDGIVKEILPNERRLATPFWLQKVVLLEKK